MKKNLLPLATLGAVVYGVRVVAVAIAARESVSARQMPDRYERLIPGRRNWRQRGYVDHFTGEPLPPAKSLKGRPQIYWHDRHQRGIDSRTGRKWVTGTKSQPSQTKRARSLWNAFQTEHDRLTATHVFSSNAMSGLMSDLFNHFNQAGAKTQICDGKLVLDPDTPPGALYRREYITCEPTATRPGELRSYNSWKGAQRQKKPKPKKKQS